MSYSVISLSWTTVYFTVDGAEYYGNVNFLKAGIVYADHVTTVSPTYAQEVQNVLLWIWSGRTA